MSEVQETLLLGADCGGSKTELVLVDPTQTDPSLIYRGSLMMGTVNPNYTGDLEATALALRDGVEELLGKAGEDPDARIAAAVFGMAGIDTADQEREMASMLSAVTPVDRIEVHNDGMLPLGVFQDRVGIALVSGAGSVCMGRNAAGLVDRVGGNGRLRDGGSGIWIAKTTLGLVEEIEEEFIDIEDRTAADEFIDAVYSRSAVAIQDMRRSKKINDGYSGDQAVRVNRFSDLHDVLYKHGADVEYRLLHTIAPTVLRLAGAERPNPYALDIARQGADTLARHVAALARPSRLDMPEVPLVVTGSLLSRSSAYRGLLSEALVAKNVSLAGPMHRVDSPARAAIKMAMQLSRQ